MPLTEQSFPEFYRRADADSDRWQKRYLRAERIQLGSLLGAAAIGATGHLALAVVLLFGVAAVAQTYRLTTKADEKWWNGRAGAESAKTASWRFVVGGAPFGLDNPGAETEFARRIAVIATEVAAIVPVPTGETHVTPQMRSLRDRPLVERVKTYQDERILDQCRWYSSKSEFNQTRATRWALAGIAVPGVALVMGIVGVTADWALDVVGFFAAFGSAIVAWVAIKQFQTLARSYAVASAELGAINVELTSREWTEGDWSSFVDNAEEAISREHTSWRATRGL